MPSAALARPSTMPSTIGEVPSVIVSRPGNSEVAASSEAVDSRVAVRLVRTVRSGGATAGALMRSSVTDRAGAGIGTGYLDP
jgi:hypothetical protein